MKSKHLLLMLLMAFLMPWAANAQTVTVCDGTNNSEKVPFDGWNADGAQHNQMIFPATDLTAMNGKSITQMVFYIDQSANNGTYTAADRLGTWTVSLGETTATTLTALDNTTTVTQVYQGYFDCSTGTTLTLLFDNDYLYQGGNLLVDLNHAAAGYNRWYFLGVNQTENTAITKGTLYKFLPKTTFTYQTPATCPKPTLSNTVTTTTTSATITWTPSNEDQTLFDIYWSTDDTAPDESTTPSAANQSGTSYTIGSLSPATQYYVWIRGNCGTASDPDISGGWTPKVSFLTDCAVISTFPYTQNFDSYAAPSGSWGTPSARTLPACWSYINTCGNSTYKYYPTIYYYSSYPDYANSTPNSLRFYSYYSSDPQDQYAILPEMANLSGLRIKLYARAYNTSYDATFHVGVMTDPTNPASFEEIASKTPTTTSYELYTISFSGYTGTGTYIAIKMDKATSSYRGVFIDDITVEEIPSCVEPTDLTMVDVTTNSVQLNWTNGSNETAWDIFCTTDATIVPDDATTPTVTNTSDKPCTVGGLSASSHYYAYIRSRCSATTQSVWSAVCEFDTECEPITITASNTLTEGFEDYEGTAYSTNGVMPICWDSYSTGSVAPHVIGSGSYYYVHNGSKALTFYGSGSCYAALPEFTNDLNDLQIDFWMRVESTTSGTLTLGYITAEDVNFNTFQVIDTYSNTGASSMVARHSYITAPATATRLVFRWYYSNQYSCCIDDVVVSLAPTCRPVSNLTCLTKTAHTATLRWTNGKEDQDAWQVAYSTDANFDPTSVTPVDVTENPGTISGLNAYTTYYAYVRANCGDGDFSPWCTTKVSFTTTSGKDYPTNLGVVSSSITSNEAQVIWKGVATNDLHESYDVYYSRLSSKPDPLEADSLFTSITDTNYYFTGLDPETKYYVWVRDVCGEDGTSLWTPSAINFTTASACETPNGLAASNVTNESAIITWNTYGLEEFNLTYSADGGSTWTTKENVNTPYELIGLTGNTTYQVKVQATCNTEEWSPVYSFTTECDAVTTFPWSENFESYSTGNFSDNCWVNEHIAGSATTNLFKITTSVGGNTSKILQLPDEQDGNMIKLVLPEMTLPNANYQFVIDVYRSNSTYNDNYPYEGIRVFASTDGEIEGATELTFIPRQYNVSSSLIPTEEAEGWYTYELPIGISGTCFIILRGESKFCTATYMDNFAVEEIPSCARPSDLACDSKTAHTATLSWTNGAEGQDAWQIAYSTTANFDPATVIPVDMTENPGTISGLDANTTYYAYVRANCGNNEYSPWSRKSCTFKTTIANAAPTGLAVDISSITSETATVNWTGVATNDNHVDYELYYSTVSTMPEELEADSLFTQIAETSYQFTGLESEKTYYVWVRDNCGTDGYSSWSTRVTFTTPSACPTPDGIAASNVTNTSATITWNVYGLDEFNLRYSDDEGETWTTKTTVNTPYELTELTAATSYQVQVQATCNTEDWSSEFSFITDICNAEDRCQITLVLTDAWGDGWNGNYLQVVDVETNIILGEFTNENMNGTTGSNTNETNPPFTLSVCDGREINFIYVLGDGNTYPAENSFVIYNNWGQVICQHEKDADGPTPGVVGTYTVNCPEATFTKPIAAHGANGEGGWHLIASPLDGSILPTAVGHLVNTETAADYDLYSFDQRAELEWVNYKNHTDEFVLESGKGYLYANAAADTLVFTGVPYSGDGKVLLSKDDDALFAGYNLVGNPFGQDAYINKVFYRMNTTGTEIEPTEATGAILPMEGVFVIADDDEEELTFSTSEPSKSANFALNVINGNNVIDRAIIQFGNGSLLPKFQLNENSTKIYIPQDGKDYAVVNAENNGEMPINFKAERNGNYTMGFSSKNTEFCYLHLIDNMTGSDIDLLATPSYNFEARTTDYASRFKLVFSTGNAAEDNFAFISNGEIIINGINGNTDVQLFDITGRMISNTNGTNRIATDNMAAGVYVLRIINGSNAKTQKIVVK